MIALNQYPQLQLIAWNRRPDAEIPDDVAFELYERHFDMVDLDEMLPVERALFERLLQTIGKGVLNV